MGLEPLQAIGIGVALAGIVYTVEKLLKYLKDPTWENFGGIIKGIGITVIGLGIAFSSLPAIVAGVAIVIIGIIVQHWEEIKALFDKAVDWLTKKMEEVKEKYGFFAGLIVEGIRDVVKSVRDALDGIFSNTKRILDNIIEFFRNIFEGKWKEAWQNLVNIAKSIFNVLMSFLQGKINVIRGMFITAFGVIGDVIGGIIKGAVNAVLNYVETKINNAIGMFNSVLSIINKIPGVNISKIGRLSLPRLAQGGIVNNPGRGVMMGSYIAGENGPEAVLPLTDGTLQKLANMMPITVYVTNTMNGRVLNRELQRVQNQTSFATNGR
jgi:phage-related protein